MQALHASRGSCEGRSEQGVLKVDVEYLNTKRPDLAPQPQCV